MATTDDRLTWPRRVENETPIVGYTCRNCDHEIEHAYKPALLTECPSCGGNPQGVRGFDVEPLVEQRIDRLRDQLAAYYGHPMTDDPACGVCGATEDVQLDPGPDLQDFDLRCPEHHRFGYKYFWQPGDHPSLLRRDWIETCDRCGAEFTSVFGVTFRANRGDYTEDVCLQCTDPEWLQAVLDCPVGDDGGESA